MTESIFKPYHAGVSTPIELDYARCRLHLVRLVVFCIGYATLFQMLHTILQDQFNWLVALKWLKSSKKYNLWFFDLVEYVIFVRTYLRDLVAQRLVNSENI